MKVLLVSDAHGDHEVIDRILQTEDYDVSIYLGDSELPEKFISERFTHYVGGNHDTYSIEESIFELEGMRVGIAHGHTVGLYINDVDRHAEKFIKKYDLDAFFYGHTHMFNVAEVAGATIVNPGSCSKSRGLEGNGYATVDIEKGEITSVDFKAA